MTVQPAEEADEKVLSVVATDGYCLRYRVWPGVQPRATMVLLHGVMSHSEWLAPLAVRLASTGLNVIGVDRRGSGLNRTDRGDAPSRQQLTADLHEIIKAQRVADQPLYLLGWCWGAVLAINAALEFGPEIAGLALVAPGLFPSEIVRGRLRQQWEQLDKTPHARGRRCVDNPMKEEMFTDGPWLDNFIRKDKTRIQSITPRFLGIMMKMGTVATTRLSELQHPMLVLLASRDEAVDNDRTLTALRNLSNKSLCITVCDARHGMQFEIPDELTSHIDSWVQRVQQEDLFPESRTTGGQ